MLVEVKVPPLPESVADATLVNWLKGPGEPVVQGENLVDLETDKVTLEVPAPEGGVLTEVRHGNNETVGSDEVIAVIDTQGEAAQSIPAEEAEAESVTQEKAPRVSPSVRKLLREHDLDASAVPTAEPGRLTKVDIERFLESRAAVAPQADKLPATLPTAAPGGRQERREPMSRLRKRIAERLVMAQHENAILTTFNEINMGPVVALRKRYREQFEQTHGVKLGFMSFFVLAAVEALRRFPLVNASIDGDDVIYHDFCDIGIAVSSPRGLVVPILRDAQQLSAAQIEATIADYAGRARANELSIEELTGGTFTITNGGVFGSLLSTPILNPPQSAILGMHKTQERPVVEDGQVVIRPMMYVALSYDHRLIDGRDAVKFLVTVKEVIEDPHRLLLRV